MEKLNLQLFAEPPADPAESGSTGSGATEKTEPKTYTEEELNAKLQEQAEKSKIDLDAEKAKWLEEVENQRKADEEEAEKLAKLSDTEREKVKLDKEKEKLARDKADFQKRELEYETSKQLVAEKLDPNFAKFLVGADAESTKENISVFKDAYLASVDEAVTQRLRGTAPAASTKPTTAATADDDKLNGIFGLK